MPDGVQPANEDGEVDHFECWPPGELRDRLLADACTTEAALVFAAAGLNAA